MHRFYDPWPTGASEWGQWQVAMLPLSARPSPSAARIWSRSERSRGSQTARLAEESESPAVSSSMCVFGPWKKGGHICPVQSIPLKAKNAKKVMDEHNSRRASRGGARSQEVAGGLAAWNPRSCCSRSCEAALEGFFLPTKKDVLLEHGLPKQTCPNGWTKWGLREIERGLEPKHPQAKGRNSEFPSPLLELELFELESRAWIPQARMDINEAVAGRQKKLFKVQDLSRVRRVVQGRHRT